MPVDQGWQHLRYSHEIHGQNLHMDWRTRDPGPVQRPRHPFRRVRAAPAIALKPGHKDHACCLSDADIAPNAPIQIDPLA
jgi:hypothetical protein